MAEFVGVYKHTFDDGNFDAFLEATGVPADVRKDVVNAPITITITNKDDGTIVIDTVGNFPLSLLEFKIGTEFEEKRLNGGTAKTIFTRDGNTLIQKTLADPPVEITREFTDDKIIATLKVKDIVNVREYTKQK